MKLHAAAVSDVGKRRKENQDNFLVAGELGLYVVADGMGGHQGGEVASKLAVEAIREYFSAHTGTEMTPEAVMKKMKESIVSANEAIQKAGVEKPELRGMGTTASAIHFPTSGIVVIGQVGDSRTYLIRPGRIWQLTRDHSLVAEKVRAGLITREQAKTDKNKNVITRSVGFDAKIEADAFWMEVHQGDVLLLCSDGLHGLLEDSDICKIVDQHVFSDKSLEKAAQSLIDSANNNGGTDNVTALLVQVN